MMKYQIAACVVVVLGSFLATELQAADERTEQLTEVIKNREWDRLSDFADVESLELWYSQIKEDDLCRLKQLSGLKELILHGRDYSIGRQYTDDSTKHLPITIESLTLEHLGHTTHAMRGLLRLKSIRHLDAHMTHIGTAGNADFSSLDSLTELHLGTISRETIISLGTCRQLRKLSFGGMNADDEALAALSELSNLEELKIGGYWMPEQALDYVKNLSGYTDTEKLIFASVRAIRKLIVLTQDADRALSQENLIKAAVWIPKTTVLTEQYLALRNDLVDSFQTIRNNALLAGKEIDDIYATTLKLAEAEYGENEPQLKKVEEWLSNAVEYPHSGVEMKELQIPDTDVSVCFPNPDFRWGWSGPTQDEYIPNRYEFRDRSGHTLRVVAEKRDALLPASSATANSAMQQWLHLDWNTYCYRRTQKELSNGYCQRAKYTYRSEKGQFTTYLQVAVFDDWEVSMMWIAKGAVPDEDAHRWFETLKVEKP